MANGRTPVRDRRRRKGLGEHTKWVSGHGALPRDFCRTPQYRRLSHGARAVFAEFTMRYMGNNNGNLEMTEEQAREAGIGSGPTLRRYLKELINAGWLIITRQGGLSIGCSLYALTIHGIDETNIKYDHPWRADSMPLHLWRDENADQRDARPVGKPKSRLATIPRKAVATVMASETRVS
jgi:hypothetical protein